MKNFDFLALLIPFSFVGIITLTIIQTTNQRAIIETKAQMPPAPASTSSSVQNPDGDLLLTLTKTSTPGSEISYSLSISGPSRPSVTIIQDNLLSGYDIKLPKNSWSNDNNKFFITKSTPEGDKYLVFRADGKTFSDGQPFIDINQYWSKFSKTLNIKTVTGWADKDLLILYTTNETGGDGPSFWFVVSTRKFLQLANHSID